jgi:hypothetical protein
MSRSIFGWSYPPGAANDPNAPWNQDDGPCAVCGKDMDHCVCPECKVCGSCGDPNCYKREGGHDLKLSLEQIVGRERVRLNRFKEQVAEQEDYIQQLESGYFQPSRDIEDNPDPWR